MEHKGSDGPLVSCEVEISVRGVPFLVSPTHRGAKNADEAVRALLANESYALFESVATALKQLQSEGEMTKDTVAHHLPQVDIRFQNLSISVDLPVADDPSSDATRAFELPTIANVVKRGCEGLGKKTRVEKHHILKDISGVFKPGTTTLVLGQPGSGKSSLMKVLSGRFPSEKNLTINGQIAYNNESCEADRELCKKLPQLLGYVTQRDIHHPNLMVQEALAFAHARCSDGFNDILSRQPKSSNGDAIAATRVQHVLTHLPGIVLELLGLQYCKDTAVGDALVRGVSGGEKKRATTGKMLFGSKLALFMDDISSGLDSAATYDIVHALQSVAKTLGTAIAISLLQPTPEVLAPFGNILILNEGEVMYHGPQSRMMAYFADLGFVCPPERDAADFLLDMGTPAQSQYTHARSTLYNPDAAANLLHSASDFARVFKQSSVRSAVVHGLEAPLDPNTLELARAFTDTVPEFHHSFRPSTWRVLKRELALAGRNSDFIKGRSVMTLVTGLLYSNVFYQFDPEKVQVVMGVTLSGALFVLLGQVSQIPSNVAIREIFYKQCRSNFYRASSLVLSSAASRIPVAIIESVVFGSLFYWMCGFSSRAASFAAFEILFFLASVVMGAWLYFLTALLPNLNAVIPAGLVSILLFVMFGGFVIPRGQIPGYLSWLYWLTPMACRVYESIDYCERFHVNTVGEYFLALYNVPADKAWVYCGMLYMIVATGLFLVASTLALEYFRCESPENPTAVRRTRAGRQDNVSAAGHQHYEVLDSPKVVLRMNSGNTTVSMGKSALEKYFAPVTLAFQDLWYTVPLKTKAKDEPQSLDLLKGASGFARLGTMTALVGASGAGKTTLLGVIAARKTGGTIRGKILLNGYEASSDVVHRATGYGEQMDIHSDASTFREALTFSAFLRQPSEVLDQLKFDSVNECLNLLDLHPIADKLVRGSSVEQLERLTIGVELAAQPSVLFLDEPTSGLDAQSAKAITEGVRKVANTGRTVVCTIHQPSTAMFEVFDNLLLLKKGGEMVYFGGIGEKSHMLVDYFERIPGVSPLEQGSNPATWILENLGAGRWCHATLAQHPRIVVRQQARTSQHTQMRFLVRRAMTSYWRNASYNLTRFIITIILATMFSVVFAGANYTTCQGINSGVGMAFLSTVFSGIVSFFSVLPVAISDRGTFYRERASQTYNALWYFLGITVAEIPYVFTSMLVFTLISFPAVGCTGVQTGVLYWINKALLILTQTYTGQLLAFALPTQELALLLSVLLNTVFSLFMGFNPPTSAIPSGFRWLYHILPKRYSFSILVALVFADCPNDARELALQDRPLDCQPLVGAPPATQYGTVKEYVEAVFGARHDDIGANMVVVLVSIVIRVLRLVALRVFNHQKR